MPAAVYGSGTWLKRGPGGSATGSAVSRKRAQQLHYFSTKNTANLDADNDEAASPGGGELGKLGELGVSFEQV